MHNASQTISPAQLQNLTEWRFPKKLSTNQLTPKKTQIYPLTHAVHTNPPTRFTAALLSVDDSLIK